MAWYANSPGKEILAHSAGVLVAVLTALAVKDCTGQTLPVEAKAGSARPEMPAATAPIVAEPEGSAVAMSPASPLALPVPSSMWAQDPQRRPHVVNQVTTVELAPPQAPAAAAPARGH